MDGVSSTVSQEVVVDKSFTKSTDNSLRNLKCLKVHAVVCFQMRCV